MRAVQGAGRTAGTGTDEDRRRIEFRARLATAAAAAIVVVSPLTRLLATDAEIDPMVADVSMVAAIVTFLAMMGLTGWWIDAIRVSWGPHRWTHRFRSVAAWLIPVVNLIAPPIEVGMVFASAGRPASWSRCWTAVWLVALVLGVFVPGVVLRVGTDWVLAALVLWLVISSMRSLRAEWSRRDDVAGLPPTAATVD
ncbi:MAG: hypothetical protein M3Y51_05025 [Actinomycetota bacterium]|nr:hypothetical protein [Actinomycetota bacterium]